MDALNFSKHLRDVISYSREEAQRIGHDYIGAEHLLLGIMREGEGAAMKILVNLGIDPQKVRKAIEDSVRTVGSTTAPSNMPLSKQADKAIRLAQLEARQFRSEVVGTEHLLLALLRDTESIPAQILANHFNLRYEQVREEVRNSIADGSLKMAITPTEPPETGDYGSPVERGPVARRPVKSKTPVLDTYGRDLTRMAEEGKLDPIIGREKEIERVAQVLSRRKKNNPVLIGDPGVGKTAIAEGLALRIVQRKVSRILFNKRVVSL
ncbi:MAG: Clp protease N-terminal domain-containing protein, partial [Bacteroidia bacterium]|nr:ATP-dependent Clp protease ATP-binding subunit [Bacteroidia bacterium]MDW8333716.1 Clp protease N-terminal domain-containing protein [Bacteroidia bacterium]